MKTTIYELLRMIKDNEAPKKIMYKEDEFEFNYNINEYIDVHSNSDDKYREFCDRYRVFATLNDEVEILETTITYKQDNKIAKFNYTLTGSEIEKIKKDILNLGIKVNEIIDRLEEL